MEAPLLNSAPQAPRLLYIRTFGCQMNEYDSLRVQRFFDSLGYRTTEDLYSADVIFLNTCSVREKAEQKVHSFIGRLRRIKAHHPGLKIIVAGCVAQQTGRQLLDRFEHIDLVMGTRAIPSLPRLLETIQTTHKRIAYAPELEESDTLLLSRIAQTRSTIAAPVTIMQGCNNFCTYCIVPYVRGRERSRPARDILREIQQLSRGGTREVLLLGQNVNSYGRGLEEPASFADLLHRIHTETDLLRIRFTTSHPKDLTGDLIRSFAELSTVCKMLHLPVQAGSDRILKRMNRGYTASQYLERIERLRELCPDISLSSDVMVGFPGESENDYEETLRLLERVRFDNLFSFRYSDRPYAKSTEFPDKVSEETKARRLNELQALQAEITLSKNRCEIGKIREVLVEGPSKTANGQLTGRTDQNRIVNFEGSEDLVGQLVRVKILAGFMHSLRGERVEPPR